MELTEIPLNLRPHCFVVESGVSVPELTHFFSHQEEEIDQWTVFLMKPNPITEKKEGQKSPIFSLACFIIHFKRQFNDDFDWMGDHSNIFTIGWPTETCRKEFKKFIIDKLK